MMMSRFPMVGTYEQSCQTTIYKTAQTMANKNGLLYSGFLTEMVVVTDQSFECELLTPATL